MSDRTCEILERRRLLSRATIDANGAVSVIATFGNDIIGISVKSSKLRVGLNNDLQQFSLASVTSISIDLGEGADYLSIAAGVRAIYCLGGLGDDTILGGEGNDTITSGGGKDLVSGGPGDDRLDGGPTADNVSGDDGADRIYGSDANDTLHGIAGVDRLFGGAGNDQLVGGSSNDKLYGDDGNDSLWGGRHNDLLTGGPGDDDILGEDGNDTLIGQDGGDGLWGDKGDDVAFGDTGDDRIHGGNGNDRLQGLGDNDTIFGEADNDSIDGGDGHDDLRGDAGLDTLSGGEGNDGLYGGFDRDTLSSGGGADRFLQRNRNNDDPILDKSADDAVVTFIDEEVQWDEDEIERMDEGLKWVVERTNNTKLLKRSNGGEIAIQRVVDLGFDTLAINIGDGRIQIANLTFDYDEPASTMVHELAHHWDTEDDNGGIKAFFDISRWRKRSGSWTYDPNSQFANSYARTNPYEDFASSFEVYFSQTKEPSLWQAKWDYMDGFLDGIST